jgi:hypothetical protein
MGIHHDGNKVAMKGFVVLYTASPLYFIRPLSERIAKSVFLILTSVILSSSVIAVSNLSKKFCEELIAYFSLVLHELHRKRRLQQFFVADGTHLPSRCLETIEGHTDRPIDSPLIRHELHRK